MKRPEVKPKQDHEIEQGGQQVRPGIDKLIVEVEQRPEAVTEAVELASVTALDVGVGFHLHRPCRQHCFIGAEKADYRGGISSEIYTPIQEVDHNVRRVEQCLRT